MNTRSWFMFADFRATPAARIRDAIAAYTARYHHAPGLILVAPGEAAPVPGITVRESKGPSEGVVAKGIVWCGRE